ncbi:hypothetical protein FH603_1709 [Spirosoma sp. LMG 31447]|uniref:Uncharacterized protein n=1 Tax=Spirosoma utsteinense TaxID=2585773 RepID=A0ABR6W3P2_9BACT|nr:hypothetical protein [Spirosoma utsteinense]
MHINFNGTVAVRLRIENRPYRLLIAYIYLFIHLKSSSHDNIHQ